MTTTYLDLKRMGGHMTLGLTPQNALHFLFFAIRTTLHETYHEKKTTRPKFQSIFLTTKLRNSLHSQVIA